MTEFTHNFYVPRFWVEGESGGRFFPSQIGDWYSIDFDFYYSFATPFDTDGEENYSVDPLGVEIADVVRFISVINQHQIICHYDILHLLYSGTTGDELNEISHLLNVSELPTLYAQYKQTLPTYVLAYDQTWCLIIPYDNDCPFFNFGTDCELTSEQLTALLTVFPRYVKLTHEGPAHVINH